MLRLLITTICNSLEYQCSDTMVIAFSFRFVLRESYGDARSLRADPADYLRAQILFFQRTRQRLARSW